MKCFACPDGKLVRARAHVQGEFQGGTYTVETMAVVCTTCGFTSVGAEDMPAYMVALRHAWELEQAKKTRVQ